MLKIQFYFENTEKQNAKQFQKNKKKLIFFRHIWFCKAIYARFSNNKKTLSNFQQATTKKIKFRAENHFNFCLLNSISFKTFDMLL